MRVSTGLERLDDLMGGGFLEKSFNLLSGTPGAGKTLFAVNYLLYHAEKDKDVLYISLEESWKNIIGNLPEGLRKRYESCKNRVHYLDFGSIRPLLGKEILNIEILGETISTSMAVHNSKIIVLDGIAPLIPHFEATKEIRMALFELSQRIKKMGGTMVFTSERAGEMISRCGVEEYVADSVILLHYDGSSRKIQILKMRGSEFIYGHHGFKIEESGIKVFPNTLPEHRSKKIEKVEFGIKGMEKIIGKMYSGDIILLSGPPGTGKTIMAYHFAEKALKNGDKVLFVSFKEGKEQILKRARELGFKIEGIKIMHRNLFEIDPYEFMWEIYENTKDVKRVIFEGIGHMELSEDVKKVEYTLLRNLKMRGITTLITHTTSDIISSYRLGTPGITYLADNIIDLRYSEIGAELRKVLVVIKSRGLEYEKGIIEYDIGKRGIRIIGKPESLEGVISGTPRHLEMKKRVEKFFKG
ncbi:KaiA-binding protein [Euryarchaeota archaeon ex4484_178]|nr:MAG: KaiA-binding protein [Euryarchaeota archaeon ex4484_178]